jgi:hypothetical protein
MAKKEGRVGPPKVSRQAMLPMAYIGFSYFSLLSHRPSLSATRRICQFRTGLLANETAYPSAIIPFLTHVAGATDSRGGSMFVRFTSREPAI